MARLFLFLHLLHLELAAFRLRLQSSPALGAVSGFMAKSPAG